MQALASTSATAAFRDALSARSVASRARSAHSRSGEANSAPCSSIASHVSPNLNVLRGPRRWGPLAAASAAYTETWSNPRGAALTQIVEGQVWAAERPFMWNSIDVGGKMAVVRLSDGSLWVHSPVELDAPLRTALAALGGEVKHIVSPNYEHVKYAVQWKKAFPGATLYGSPGMMGKKPEIPWDAEIGVSNEAPAAWLGEIDLTFFDCETTPVVGGAFFNEVVFIHVPSGCLMVTDLFWNYPDNWDVPIGTRLWKLGMDEVYLPFYRKAMVDRPSAFRAAADRVLGWEFDSLLPCHGSFVSRGAKAIMRGHLVL